jgi:2-phosphoglycolate phosphatase
MESRLAPVAGVGRSEDRRSADAAIRLVIFDFDGVLADTVEDIADSANTVRATYRLPSLPVERVCAAIRGGAEGIMRSLLPDDYQSELPAAASLFTAEYAKCYQVHTHLYPGVAKTLADLQADGLVMAVATNKVEAVTRDLTRILGIERCFAMVVGPESVSHRKPDPETLEVILKHLGVSPGEALMVGDTTTDIEAGRAAHVATCAVLYGYGSREEIEGAKPDHFLESFEGLPDLLDAIERLT